jgi:hypothetical protein
MGREGQKVDLGAREGMLDPFSDIEAQSESTVGGKHRNFPTGNRMHSERLGTLDSRLCAS